MASLVLAALSPVPLSDRHLPLISPINTPHKHSAVEGCCSGRDKDKRRSGKKIEVREKGGREMGWGRGEWRKNWRGARERHQERWMEAGRREER